MNDEHIRAEIASIKADVRALGETVTIMATRLDQQFEFLQVLAKRLIHMMETKDDTAEQ